MRLKVFTAATIGEAIARVRRELGEDAIIVSTETHDDGVQVTAAVEGSAAEAPAAAHGGRSPDWARAGERAESGPGAEEGTGRTADEIRQALTYHGVPAALVDRLAGAAAVMGTENRVLALAGAFDALFGFAPLPATRSPARPLMFVGPPGAGKTLAVAKLATRARRSGHAPMVLTTDTQRAGGIEQLEAFTRILAVDFVAAESSPMLVDAVVTARGRPVYIDTAGANPLSSDDVALVRELAQASAAEPILVLPAGGDAMEAADTAAAFADAGVRRLVTTRLDAARRLGGILSGADAARLAFAEASISPRVADPLVAVNPVSLARLLLPDDSPADPTQKINEAAL